MSKFAVRAMAQSLAREFGPKGIHVAHAIVDGIIDTEQTKGFHEELPGSKISPDQVSVCSSRERVLVFNHWYRLRRHIGICIRRQRPRLRMNWIFGLIVKAGKECR